MEPSVIGSGYLVPIMEIVMRCPTVTSRLANSLNIDFRNLAESDKAQETEYGNTLPEIVHGEDEFKAIHLEILFSVVYSKDTPSPRICKDKVSKFRKIIPQFQSFGFRTSQPAWTG